MKRGSSHVDSRRPWNRRQSSKKEAEEAFLVYFFFFAPVSLFRPFTRLPAGNLFFSDLTLGEWDSGWWKMANGMGNESKHLGLNGRLQKREEVFVQHGRIKENKAGGRECNIGKRKDG
jgi:hypothetical protein